MLEDYALLTYTELKEYLEIPNDSKQALYENLINTASMIANNITGRKLVATDYTSIFDGNGNTTLTLPQYPINSITEVNIDVKRNFTTDTRVSSFGFNETNGILRLFNRSFPEEPHSVKVIYNAGFVDIPSDIKTATTEIVSFLYNRRNSQLIGKKSINTGDGISESFELSIPLNSLKILEMYKK